MRCLTLATRLAAEGASVSFVCREHAGNMCNTIRNRWKFTVHGLALKPEWAACKSGVGMNEHAGWLGADWEDDAQETIQAISSQSDNVNWLIVDHYALDERWENKVRPFSSNLMVIDDLADRRHDCDVLLDQNLHSRVAAARYDKLIPSDCRRLLGPRYALLRPEFLDARAALKARDGSVRRLLVFFGGVDANNETGKALEAIRSLDRPDIAVDVIVGSANSNLEDIRSKCIGLPNAKLHCDPNNIAALISNADLAIGATGATSWERCCLGLPAVVVSLAPNQESIARALSDNGLAIYLGKRQAVTAGMITKAIEEFLRSPAHLQKVSLKCAELADGHGTERVARALDARPISLRLAQVDDSNQIYRWRNAEETRRYSHQTSVIPVAEHQEWIERVLTDPARLILIGECDGQPVGVIRYDREGQHCTISIYLVPGQHRQGHGPRLLRAGHEWLKTHRPELKSIRAEVLPENRPSAEAFLQTGYRYDGRAYVKTLD